MTELGYEVKKQEYEVKDVHVDNLEWQLTGEHHPEEIILVGAHYDSVLGSPGANDNASGVAAVLELHVFSKQKIFLAQFGSSRSLIEEPPFLQTDKMGAVSMPLGLANVERRLLRCFH